MFLADPLVDWFECRMRVDIDKSGKDDEVLAVDFGVYLAGIVLADEIDHIV